MDTDSSRQFLEVTEGERPQAAEEMSQEEHQEAKQSKDYTTSIIGWILRGGVILSATIILIGLLLLLVHAGQQPENLMGSRSFPHSMSQVWSGVLRLQPEAIIVMGLLLLIATPVITVMTSLVTFMIKRDVRFVVITCIVLAILLTSLFIGKGG